MNVVNSVNNAATGAAAAPKAGTGSAFGLKNEFLEMMVAQIQNQDPLDPLDGTEYVGQLAQFSMVEGVEGLRKGQSAEAELLYTQQVLQSTNLIGKKVLVPTTGIAAEQGEKPEGVIRLDSGADEVVLTVKNLNGEVIDQQKWQYTQAGDIRFELPELDKGSYVFDVEARSGEQVIQGAPLLSRQVERVMLPSSGGDIKLAVAGMGSVSLFSISEFSQNNS